MSLYKPKDKLEELANVLYTLCENRALTAQQITTEVIGHVGVIPISEQPVYKLVKKYRDTRVELEATARDILKELTIPDRDDGGYALPSYRYYGPDDGA
jgi:hypothetical protein